MYTNGSLKVGQVMDTSNDDYRSGRWASLPHSCNDWVIGGVAEIDALISDLQQAKIVLEKSK